MFYLYLFLGLVLMYFGIWFSYSLVIAVVVKRVYTLINMELLLASGTLGAAITLLFASIRSW